MACCGKKRNEFLHNQSMHHQANNSTMGESMGNRYVQFEYTGFTGLTAIGSITGKRYRFAQKGDAQPVDYRDVPAMMGIAVLRKLSV